MAQVHLYIGVENLALSGAHRGTLIIWLRSLGTAMHRNPSRRNHWRTRLDNEAAIFEAQFDEASLTVATVKGQLAGIFGVAVATISHSVTSPVYDVQATPVVTFTHGGTDYIRFAVFGGVAASWEQSRLEVVAYLKANAAEWEPTA